MFDTIAQIKRANEASDSPYWFSKETMAHFNSRIHGGVWYKAYNPERLFITSEDNYDRSGIRFTIRRFNPDTGLIDTLGEFQQYGDLSEAEQDLITGGYKS